MERFNGQVNKGQSWYKNTDVFVPALGSLRLVSYQNEQESQTYVYLCVCVCVCACVCVYTENMQMCETLTAEKSIFLVLQLKSVLK